MACDDGDACIAEPSCQAGICIGAFQDCDDGELCTMDSCDSEIGCEHEVLDGIICEDGDLCITGEVCNNGVCEGGVSGACDDGNDCMVDTCDAQTGECIYSNMVIFCDNGNVCIINDLCVDGIC